MNKVEDNEDKPGNDTETNFSAKFSGFYHLFLTHFASFIIVYLMRNHERFFL